MIKTNELENNKSKPSFNYKHDVMHSLWNEKSWINVENDIRKRE